MITDELTLPDVAFTNMWRDNDLVRNNDFDNLKADHYGAITERAVIKATQSSSLTGGGGTQTNTITTSLVEIASTPADPRTLAATGKADQTDGTITVRIKATTTGATINSASTSTGALPPGITFMSPTSTTVKHISGNVYEITTNIRFITNGQITNVPIGPIQWTLNLSGNDTVTVSDIAPITPSITTTLQDARAQVYRYLLFVDITGGSSGHAELRGNDAVVSVGAGFTGHPLEEVGTTMHEIGHNLNLDHGGPVYLTSGAFAYIPLADTGINCKPNYPSVMSYSKQMPYFVKATGWDLDFSSGYQGPINENAVVEDPINIGSAELIVWGTPLSSPNFRIGMSNTVIDWDGDGSAVSGTTYGADVNNLRMPGCKASPSDPIYKDYDDWMNLDLEFRKGASGQFDGHGPLEAEADTAQALQAAIQNAQFETTNPPIQPHGDSIKASKSIPIKFDITSIFDDSSIENLETAMELWYWIGDENTIPEANPSTATIVTTCERDATHYHCPTNIQIPGRYFFHIMLIDPATDEPSDNSPLISITKPIEKKTLGYSFWVDIT